MNKKTATELMITGFLAVALFFSVRSAVGRIGNAKRERRPGKAASPQIKAAPFHTGAGLKEKQLGGSYAELEEEAKAWKLKKDPFTGEGIVSQEGASSVIVLSGIFWDGSYPMAIVNDAVITIGDTVDGYLVTDIRQDKVILRKGPKDLELQWD
ncbi:MAG: hypothetical protein PHG31_01130 [Candidatus Omnitrophica bacterium]|nr:hypothetical protein [Candidatus Omnitrophota bacterium]